MSISPFQPSSLGVSSFQQSGGASGLSAMLNSMMFPSTSSGGTSSDTIGQSGGSGQSELQKIEQELQMLIQLLMQLIQTMAQASGGAVGGQGNQGGGGQQVGGQNFGGQQPQSGGDSVQQGGGNPQPQQPGWNTTPQSNTGGSSGASGSTGTTGTDGSSGAAGTSGSSGTSGSTYASKDYSNTTSDTTGLVTAGTHPLRPVPLNGGEHKETPTSVGDINKVINDIDPTLLTNPDQKGEGVLKGLPRGKMFEAAGKATGVDPRILYADSQVETGDNKNGRILEPNNINPIQTAPGVWPTTNNAATNLFTGAYVMKDYINKAGGDLKVGLNAYNTGNVSPTEKGFADGYPGYYQGVMAAFNNVNAAIKDPSIVGPGQGGNVDPATQI